MQEEVVSICVIKIIYLLRFRRYTPPHAISSEKRIVSDSG